MHSPGVHRLPWCWSWGAALGSVHPFAQAAKWELVAQSNNGFYYIDPRSVETSGDRKTAWTVLDHRELQSLRGGTRYRSTHAQVQFNCKANLARIVHLSYPKPGSWPRPRG